jgi:hypothetical protein
MKLEPWYIYRLVLLLVSKLEPWYIYIYREIGIDLVCEFELNTKEGTPILTCKRVLALGINQRIDKSGSMICGK